MNIRLVGVELFCADGQTDRRAVIWTFAKKPKMLSSVVLLIVFWLEGTKFYQYVCWNYLTEKRLVSVSSFRWFLNPYGEAHGWPDFRPQGSFNLVKETKYLCKTFLYSSEKCTITDMSVMFQHHTTSWWKGKWIWKITRSKAELIIHKRRGHRNSRSTV